MTSPYIGEVRMFAGTFAPVNWALCNGQVIAISQNEALYQLLGTTYGGDGVNTFNLPDVQGRVPIHQGTGTGLSTYVIGQKAGSESVTLTTSQMPQHNHTLAATTTAATAQAVGPTLLPAMPTATNAKLYTIQGATPTIDAMSVRAVGPAGGSQPHENRMPALAVTFIIALFGIFPSQN
jgi:microcystin-dependent protein